MLERIKQLVLERLCRLLGCTHTPPPEPSVKVMFTIGPVRRS